MAPKHLALKHFVSFLLLLALGIASPPPAGVTLALLGDVMLGRGVADAHAGAVDWEAALSQISPALLSADLALANLESPITAAPLQPTGRGIPYDLRAGLEGLHALAASGLDMVSIANNHIFDSGQPGAADTQSALSEAGLTALGPGPTPVWISLNGIRLAFLALENVSTPLDLQAAVQVIHRARQVGALVVVSVHWGSEFRPGPDERQKELARAFAEAGACLVWGHHPHVLQPLAWIHGETQPFPTLVAYSLGNALFDQLTPPDARRSALILVKMDRAGVQSVRAIPFEIDVPGGRLVEARPEIAEAVLLRLGKSVLKGEEDARGWPKSR